MRRDRRLSDILEAGARVLAERGVHGATMRAVAREARTSVANLYHYVGSREELVYRVQLRLLEVAVASAQATAGARGARERLRALVADHIRRVLARPAEADALRGVPGALRGDRARRVEEARRRYLALARAALEGALGRGLPAGRTGDLWVALLLAMAERAALESLRGRAAADPDRLASPILGLVLGARAPGGRGR